MRRVVRLLRTMPSVVSVADLEFQGIADAADVLGRLAHDGFLDHLGGNLYYNPLSGQPLDLFLAVQKAVAAPVVHGPTVLHDFGITTQRPSVVFILAVGDTPVPDICGVDITHISARRFMRWRKHVVWPDQVRHPMYPIPWLKPHAAWRFMCEELGHAFGLHEDDLDWELGEEEGWKSALEGPGIER